MTTLIFLIVCLIFKLIVDNYNKPFVSDVDQIINCITEKKPIKYISNGVELKTTLKRHYFNILDLMNGKVYDRETSRKPHAETEKDPRFNVSP